MAEKKITRKIISPSKKGSPLEKKAVLTEKAAPDKESRSTEETVRTKRACSFCQGKLKPSYTDIASLRRFTTDRAKIVAKLKSNLCSRHQRAVTGEIKYARHLGMLPFVPKV